MKYNSSKQKTPFIFYLGLTLLLMVMLTTHMSTGLLARYMSFSEGGDSARAASFAIEVGETLTQSFELSLKPGESQTKKISITCKSEVAVNYTVKAETVGNLPLTLSWEEGRVEIGGVTACMYRFYF